MKTKATKSHRDRKNPGSRESYRKEKSERNRARGVQVFNPVTKTWRRE